MEIFPEANSPQQFIDSSQEQHETNYDDEFIAFSLNIPHYDCFQDTIWAPLRNLIRGVLSVSFHQEGDKTLQFRAIPLVDFKIILDIFLDLYEDLFGLDLNLPTMKIYNAFDNKKCKFIWRWEVMSKSIDSNIFDLLINIRKLVNESNSIDPEWESEEITPIAGAIFTYYYNYKYFFVLDMSTNNISKLREEIQNNFITQKYSDLCSIFKMNHTNASSRQDLNNVIVNINGKIVGKMGKNLQGKYGSKVRVNLQEIRNKSNSREVEISNLLVFSSEFSDRNYSHRAVEFFKQESVLIQQKENSTFIYSMEQENFYSDYGKRSVISNMNQNIKYYITMLWANGDDSKKIETKRNLEFSQELRDYSEDLSILVDNQSK